MTLKDIAEIETIVRQAWVEEDSPFASWLSVDQDQALALIQMIHNRLPVHPRPVVERREDEQAVRLYK